MAALIYTLCQNVYKNIFYVHASTKINKKIGINYFIKQLLAFSNDKQSINNKLIQNTVTSNINRRNVYNTALLQNPCFMNKFMIRYVQNERTFSSIAPNPKPDPPKRSLPPLMEFPEIVWPSVFKSVRNWILSTLIIAPYFDREFSLYDFVTGSKQAIEVVSNKISSGELKELEGLVTNDAVDAITKSVSLLTLSQRQQLAINRKDIYFSFPYQVGIMFDDGESSQQKRFVEITMVYHVLQDLHLMRERGEEPPLNVGLLPEFRDKIHICNYRFIREYTKGVEDQWTINLINHFKPSDFL